MRLLLAEDERDLSKALVTILNKEKYIVDAVYDGKDALKYGLSGNYDGIILDVMMPEMNGIDVLKLLREKEISVPILLLTAKSEISDRVSGLDAGADDYLTKPFAITELLARVRAMLRRKSEFVPTIMQFGGLCLNKATFELVCNDNAVRLGSREFQMMEMLMENPHNVIPTAQFMEKIWGTADAEMNVVWVYISNLRKKLAALGTAVEIKAVRGVGYSLEVEA